MQNSSTTETFYEMDSTALNTMIPHCAVMLVLDTSHSMWGQGLSDMKAGLKAFFETFDEREFTGSQLDVAAVGMGDNLCVLQEFKPFEESTLPAMNIRPKGNTPMGAALEMACQLLTRQMEIYAQQGVQAVTPHLILLSDGQSSDDFQPISEKIRSATASGLLIGHAVATGKNPDMASLRLIFGDNVILPLHGDLKQTLAKVGEVVSQCYEGEVTRMMLPASDAPNSQSSVNPVNSVASSEQTIIDITPAERPESPETEYLLDGTNICYWGREEQGITLKYVDAIARHCEACGIPYQVCFDASTPHILEHQSEEEVKHYRELLAQKPENFKQVPAATRADDFLLLMADDNPNAIIISQDLYRDHTKKHPWLANSKRVVPGMVLQNKIYFPDINVKIAVD